MPDKPDEPGPTGQYPEGKIDDSDRGELGIRMFVTAEGKVVMDFGTTLEWIAFGPVEAIGLGEALIRMGTQASGPDGIDDKIEALQRETDTARANGLALLINSSAAHRWAAAQLCLCESSPWPSPYRDSNG